MSDNKNVPDIRFHGFTECWEKKALGDVSGNTYGGGTPRTSVSEYWKGDIPWIQSSDLTDSKLSNIRPQKNITQNGIRKSATKLIPANSIAVVTRVGVGKLALMEFEYATSQDFVSLSKLKINNWFGTYSIWRAIQQQLHAVQGTSIKGLTKSELLDYCIMVPEYEKEQSQIGNYFQNLDKLITQNQNKHNQLVNLKKAMLEKMFPKEGSNVPEIRFKGFSTGWDIQKFGECVLIQRGGSPRPIENFMTKDVDGINWVKIGDVSKTSRYITKTKEKIIHAGEKHSRKVYKGDLILSNSMSFGRPYIMAIDGCIHDGWLLIRDENKNFDLEYLLQLLSSDYMLNQYKALASGGVVINLNSELVQSTTVYLPSIEEQQKIGSYFQNLDKLIALQKQQLEKLKNIKKACLDKMFV